MFSGFFDWNLSVHGEGERERDSDDHVEVDRCARGARDQAPIGRPASSGASTARGMASSMRPAAHEVVERLAPVELGEERELVDLGDRCWTPSTSS